MIANLIKVFNLLSKEDKIKDLIVIKSPENLKNFERFCIEKDGELLSKSLFKSYSSNICLVYRKGEDLVVKPKLLKEYLDSVK